MSAGWIKMFKKIEDWEWYDDSYVVHVFLHCLISANFKDGEWKNQHFKRGQFISSPSKISEKTGISVQSVKTSISKLRKSGELTSKGTNKNTVYTVVRYEMYQGDEVANQQTNQQTNQPRQQRLTTDEEVNNINNIPLLEIVDFLNAKCQSNFKSKTPKTKSLIKARMSEGFTLDDFKKVIDVKAKEWTGTDFEKYLKPEVLFGNKFEGYLNQYKPEKEKKKGKSYAQLMADEYAERFRRELPGVSESIEFPTQEKN